MSYSKLVTLWCDTEDCVQNYEHDRAKVADARKYARRDGWTTENPGDGRTRDYCPDCSAERAASEDTDSDRSGGAD